MFCPQCGTTESDELKFCKSCGANLSAVRQAASRREKGDPSNPSNTWSEWVLEANRVKAIAKDERERRRGLAPEAQRIREVKAGVITASAGVALGVFLNVFMQGIILGARITPEVGEILSWLWIVGVIPLCIGMGLLINGLFVKTAVKKPATKDVLEREAQQDSLNSGESSGRIASGFSVTEQTTRQLRGADLKE